MVIRGYETQGKDIQVIISPFWEIEEAWTINLIEEERKALQSNAQSLSFESRGFEIKTFQLNLRESFGREVIKND